MAVKTDKQSVRKNNFCSKYTEAKVQQTDIYDPVCWVHNNGCATEVLSTEVLSPDVIS